MYYITLLDTPILSMRRQPPYISFYTLSLLQDGVNYILAGFHHCTTQGITEPFGFSGAAKSHHPWTRKLYNHLASQWYNSCTSFVPFATQMNIHFSAFDLYHIRFCLLININSNIVTFTACFRRSLKNPKKDVTTLWSCPMQRNCMANEKISMSEMMVS